MKRIILALIIFVNIILAAQSEYVPVTNRVYEFLERMESLHFIKAYNSFEIPKDRKEIASYIKQVIENDSKLDLVDKQILEDLKIEFEFELFETLNNTQSIIGGEGYNPLNQNEHYLFSHSEKNKFNLFVNLIGEAGGIFLNSKEPEKNLSTSTWLYGGEIRGTVLDKLGFYIRGTNGIVAGNLEAALLKRELKSNFKLNLAEDEKFFDETEGYVSADFDLVKLKFGRQKFDIGYGPFKMISGANSPAFDYLSFRIGYSFFNFSYYHSKIGGASTVVDDTVQGSVANVAEKYFGYHRIGFDISRHFKFGIGEMIIYGERPMDFSYVNPFNFYKTVEHSNQDRDNALLFADVSNNSVEGLKLYATLLIDDLNAGKIGTGWWGNQTMITAGLNSYNLYPVIPLDFSLQYLRIEPYTFTHRLMKNNFTNMGYSLGPDIAPNSELFFCQINYRLNHRLNFSTSISLTNHGANPVDENGVLVKNVGGNINVGHRLQDAAEVNFLDGAREVLRSYSLSISYEPFNQMFFLLRSVYKNHSLQGSVSNRQFESYFSVIAKF
ncbi:MAG: hypothetical protein IPM56_08510 [Ignavibacteriales bacterium]|nr:MAG: hypothetical protein IPM56_08510 [Ignavibacteriales bacterium]